MASEWNMACGGLEFHRRVTSRSVLPEKLQKLHCTSPCWACSLPSAEQRWKFCKSNANGGNLLEWKEHSYRSESVTNQVLSLASVSSSASWIKWYLSGQIEKLKIKLGNLSSAGSVNSCCLFITLCFWLYYKFVHAVHYQKMTFNLKHGVQSFPTI